LPDLMGIIGDVLYGAKPTLYKGFCRLLMLIKCSLKDILSH
jgi:hypothetical protein